MSHRLSAFCLASIIAALSAHPASAGWTDHKRFTVRQPDGNTISIVVTGDEFHARIESAEGQTLVRDAGTGWYDLARFDAATGRLVSRGIHWSPKMPAAVKAASEGIDLPLATIRDIRTLGRAHRAKSMSPAPAPKSSSRAFALAPVPAKINDTHIGDFTGLTLLIDFPDDPATWSPAIVDSVLNREGYSRTGVENSIYDFYKDVSGGKLKYKNIVMDHYYRTPLPKAAYQDFLPMCGLIREVLQHLEDGGFDFSPLTTGSDGQARAVNIFYAGTAPGGGNGLWPHTGVLEDGSFAADGIWISRHQVTWLQHDAPYVGTFAHENGHMLMGWPDLYDNDGSSSGVGPYCLMGWDDWVSPQRPNPSLRVAAGWDEVVELNAAPAGAKFSIGSTQNRSFRFKNPARAEEYFLIDARPTRTKHWPHDHGGLAIWHVDVSKDVNAEEQMTEEFHYRVSLEQSDGQFHLEAGQGEGGRNFFFHTATKTVFHDGTLPNARWWNGDESHLHIRKVSSEPAPNGANSSMTFETGAWPTLPKYAINTAPGLQGQVINLAAACNLPNGAQGAQPASSINFGTTPKVGDRLFLNTDGSSYATPLTGVSAWWLGFHWSTPYVGPGSKNGPCSLLRGAGAGAHGAIVPQGPYQVSAGRTETFQIYPHAGRIVGDVRVDGVSVGPVYTHTLHNIGAPHTLAVDFVPGELKYRVTVQGWNGPGSYTGSGEFPAETWTPISATPGTGFTFDHWIVTYGKARIEDDHARSTRVFLDRTSVVLAVYLQAVPPCGGTQPYRDGAAYATGDMVYSVSTRYQCKVGGWCSAGGPYAPGAGWAWQNAWAAVGSCP